MTNKIQNLLPSNFKDYKVKKIDREASRREYYRLRKDGKSAILMDSLKEPNEFLNFLKIHNILSKINISIPKIYEIDSKEKLYYWRILEI